MGAAKSRNSKPYDKSTVGYETHHDRVVTRTELLPELLEQLGLTQHAQLLPRLLSLFQDDYSYRPRKERQFNLTDICQRINGPSFESWFREKPVYSIYNYKLLKHFAFLLNQRNIVIPPQRNYSLRPDRKAVP